MEKKNKENKENKPVITRAEKRDNVKNLIREILVKGSAKASDLIDEAAKLYAERFGGEDTENMNDVKGRVGSVLDVMKKDSDVQFDGGVYALNEPKQEEKAEEKPVKKTRKSTKKAAEENKDEPEKPVKAKRAASKKKEEKKEEKEEKVEPLPPAPLQPIAPTAPTTPEIAPEPIPEDTVKNEEKTEPKKRGRKPRAEKKAETKTEEIKAEEIKIEEKKTDLAPKGTLMDMSFLLKDIKPVEKPQPKPVEKSKAKQEIKQEIKQEANPEKKAEVKKTTQKTATRSAKKPTAPLTADEKLQEAFLNKLRRLGGEYFEYYSVYLLEKYSRKNGRRLESLKITGGDHDGGIDGEIELTDKLGFKETIYIQSKNWDPGKGSEKLWVVGETLLQQFIGACVCRQAKDGKQRCRGIFMTTSRFTPEAKRILADTSDNFVGYDGADVYETAKECEFGLVKKNGEWALDEQLLSGMKAFFNMN